MLFFFRPIKLNDKGRKVRKIAFMLQKHGSSIKLTDEFTIGMKSAVKSFQKKHNLIPMGTVDRETWRELKKKPK